MDTNEMPIHQLDEYFLVRGPILPPRVALISDGEDCSILNPIVCDYIDCNMLRNVAKQ